MQAEFTDSSAESEHTVARTEIDQGSGVMDGESVTLLRRTLLRQLATTGAAGWLGAVAGCADRGGNGPTTTGSGGIGTTSETVNAIADPTYGAILVDASGLSLYVFVPDTPGTSTCYGQCADVWPPLLAEGTPTKGEEITAKIRTVTRKNGPKQVTVAGHPLYLYRGDKKPGDTKGQGVKQFGGTWYLIAPDGSKRTKTRGT
jgi:predicted lipoprotein with Yx(FWY)xxD motif